MNAEELISNLEETESFSVCEAIDELKLADSNITKILKLN